MLTIHISIFKNEYCRYREKIINYVKTFMMREYEVKNMISKRKLYDQNILYVHGNSQIEDIGKYNIRFSPSLNNIILNNEEYSMSNVTKYLNNDKHVHVH